MIAFYILEDEKNERKEDDYVYSNKTNLHSMAASRLHDSISDLLVKIENQSKELQKWKMKAIKGQILIFDFMSTYKVGC